MNANITSGDNKMNETDDEMKIDLANSILDHFGVDMERYCYLIQIGAIDIKCIDNRSKKHER